MKHARNRQLVVFVKAPRPGLVKTRLAEQIGESAACQTYRILVETLCHSLSRLEDVELRYTPEDALSEIQDWAGGSWTCRPQGEGDLGRRLQAAFSDAFNSGKRQVVVIGSDCPAITRDDIEEAWRSLASRDVVLGPARDGGYWLIGLRAPQPCLWENMPWSTDCVLTETLARIRRAGLTVHLLRELRDVDTEPDWREFLAGQKVRKADRNGAWQRGV